MSHARTSKVSGMMEMLIFRCLEKREMYGYELVQAVHELTSGEVDIREGLLYPLLHAHSAAGRLARRRETVDGRPRVYYRLTARGRKHSESLRGEWSRVVQAVSRALA